MAADGVPRAHGEEERVGLEEKGLWVAGLDAGPLGGGFVLAFERGACRDGVAHALVDIDGTAAGIALGGAHDEMPRHGAELFADLRGELGLDLGQGAEGGAEEGDLFFLGDLVAEDREGEGLVAGQLEGWKEEAGADAIALGRVVELDGDAGGLELVDVAVDGAFADVEGDGEVVWVVRAAGLEEREDLEQPMDVGAVLEWLLHVILPVVFRSGVPWWLVERSAWDCRHLSGG